MKKFDFQILYIGILSSFLANVILFLGFDPIIAFGAAFLSLVLICVWGSPEIVSALLKELSHKLGGTTGVFIGVFFCIGVLVFTGYFSFCGAKPYLSSMSSMDPWQSFAVVGVFAAVLGYLWNKLVVHVGIYFRNLDDLDDTLQKR